MISLFYAYFGMSVIGISDVLEAPKVEASIIRDVVSEDQTTFRLGDFSFKRVLNSNSNRKTIFLLGEIKDKNGDAILTLEKKAFNESDLNENGYFNDVNELQKHFHNDIYGNYDCFPKPSLNGVKLSLIHPATEKHILKFSQQVAHLILETPELYNTVTKPHIEKEQFSLEWVYNILNGTKEADRIVFNDPSLDTGFVLLPDLKWDGHSQETLYLLAIPRVPGLLSIRELRKEHLPLLRNIRDKGQEAILQRYGLDRSRLRVYLHYQPSFYYLHVHFTYLQYEAPGTNVEKSHLLDTVINNIEIMSDYYQQATLPCTLRENEKLYTLICEHSAK